MQVNTPLTFPAVRHLLLVIHDTHVPLFENILNLPVFNAYIKVNILAEKKVDDDGIRVLL